jgi:hypothetical protein
VRTPLEWRQAIYEEKLAQARERLLRITTFRPCAGSSMPIWMKRVFAPFDRESDLRL